MWPKSAINTAREGQELNARGISDKNGRFKDLRSPRRGQMKVMAAPGIEPRSAPYRAPPNSPQTSSGHNKDTTRSQRRRVDRRRQGTDGHAFRGGGGVDGTYRGSNALQNRLREQTARGSQRGGRRATQEHTRDADRTAQHARRTTGGYTDRRRTVVLAGQT